MIFGKPEDFAIEARPGPPDRQWRGYGHIRVHVQGVEIGDITQGPGILLLAAERFRVLHPAVDRLWDSSLSGLSDQEILTTLDRALYAGGDSGWKRYGRFEFLTNAGKAFDGHKSFIVRHPDGWVHILYQLPDGTSGSASCRVRSFRSAAGQFTDWYGGQLRESGAPDSYKNRLILP